MVKYTLTYFNLYGRAETARLIFAAAGQEFEDKRIDHEAFAKLKPTLFFGQLPVLHVDGAELGQSMAINRFLGRTFHLAGKDDWEAAQCDMLADGLSDVTSGFGPWMREKDEEKKKALLAELVEEKVKPYCARLEKVLTKQGNGHLVGSGLTWVDLSVFQSIGAVGQMVEGLMKAYPKVASFVAGVGANPKIKAYLEQRPKCPF